MLAGDLNSTDRGRDRRPLLADAGLADAMRDGRARPDHDGSTATVGPCS